MSAKPEAIARLRAKIDAAPEIGPIDESPPEGRRDDAATPELFHVEDMSRLEADEPEGVDWCWEGYIPRGHVTLLGGHGGTGKSTFMLQVAACAAAGAPCLGRDTGAARVLFYSGEDDSQLVFKRLRRIVRRLGLDASRVRARLQVLDASELAPVLFTEVRADGVRRGVTTATYRALADFIKAGGFDLVLVDNASDVFDADEINRPLVRQFIRDMKRLVIAVNGALVLLAHVDKITSRAGKAGANEAYSGSTAWHNSVRSRLFLLETGAGAFELQHQKCNVAPKQPPMALDWPADDVLHPAQTGGLVALLRDKADSRALLRLVHEFTQRGEWVTPAASGPRCVSALLAGERGYPHHLKPREALAVMRDAQRDELVRVVAYKAGDRHQRERWELTAKGVDFVGAGVAGVAASSGTAAIPARGQTLREFVLPGGVGELPHAPEPPPQPARAGGVPARPAGELPQGQSS